jgi:thiosulfate/3-mercaptopyruvate sulfurtransferase
MADSGGVMTGTAGPLVDPGALAAMLAGSRPPVVLDVRWRMGGPPGADSYRAGHLPGAVFMDLDRDLAGAPGRDGRHPLPDTVPFQAAMRRAGVSGARPVVVYDEADSMAAARAWWLLRYYGHPRVRVLDGGYRAWAAAGGPVVTGNGALPEPGDFHASPGHMALVDAAGAALLARRGTLLDARAPQRYRGEAEPVDAVAGHIPGAVSAPAAQCVTPDGHFLPAAALAARFGELGLRPAGPGPSPDGTAGPLVGAYCGSGVVAAHEVLALAIAGIPAALYVGSWSQWITDPDRPVSTGPDPG